jgi:hypothetical protein
MSHLNFYIKVPTSTTEEVCFLAIESLQRANVLAQVQIPEMLGGIYSLGGSRGLIPAVSSA